jgi:Fe-S-cluster-containing hydrogenase component 2
MDENGLPVVDEEKCTGCGICVKAGPRDIIRLIPRSQEVYVGCVSKDKGKGVRSICKVGCFGCGLCAKAAVDGAITMNGNLPEIQSEDMEKMAKAIEKCPAKVFVMRDNVSNLS